MINGPILVTERLILRPPAAEDFEAFAAFSSDEEMTRFIGGVMQRGAAWRAWATLAGAWHLRGFSMFSVVLRESGDWIGRIGPWEPEGWPDKEIGWGIAPEYAGKGYACEAAVACMDYAFDLLGWEKVIHTIDPENIASIKLAERLGSTNKGPTQLPPPLHEFRVDSYEQTREEWQENRKQFKGG
ncbi:GNAT family N-acetyltransferase [Alterisphingorhabdus coralli]|uniref:GNAT family N-acetyltransferase n=1 Tax=Alterisphingorhabdus coralli TaxID=3071408 RepID=A0AA97I2Y6_9SPHN|nr:GNAT family N-acetyltransferase [Parasphingorhabdus sp. SCSIO 66989]WOE76205.1 GNAT family N-acetyltransferase [Parasphingorhabdus sp. SCSIO 66989]